MLSCHTLISLMLLSVATHICKASSLQIWILDNIGAAMAKRLFVIMGQSNAVGTNEDLSSANINYRANERIFHYSRGYTVDSKGQPLRHPSGNAGDWIPGHGPLQSKQLPHSRDSVGIDRTFAEAMAAKYPDDEIYLINCSVGATSFRPITIAREWTPGQWTPWGYVPPQVKVEEDLTWDSTKPHNPYSDINQQNPPYTQNLFTEAVQDTNNILASDPDMQLSGVIWQQGVHDTFPDSVDAYPTNLENLIVNFRAQVNDTENVPFVVGAMHPDFRASNPLATKIDDAHRNIVNNPDTPNVGYASSDNISDPFTDGVHYSANGLRELGHVYSDQYSSISAKIEQDTQSLTDLLPAADSDLVPQDAAPEAAVPEDMVNVEPITETPSALPDEATPDLVAGTPSPNIESDATQAILKADSVRHVSSPIIKLDNDITFENPLPTPTGWAAHLAGKSPSEWVTTLNEVGLDNQGVVFAMKSQGFHSEHVARGLFTTGISTSQITDVLHNGGYSVEDCFKGLNQIGVSNKLTVNQLRECGINNTEIAGGLKALGNNPAEVAANLRQELYAEEPALTVAAMKGAGYSSDEISLGLKDSGYRATYVAYSMKENGYDNDTVASSMNKAGFVPRDLKEGMINTGMISERDAIESLGRAGVTEKQIAQSLQNNEITIQPLQPAGLTYIISRNVGVSNPDIARNMRMYGYNSEEVAFVFKNDDHTASEISNYLNGAGYSNTEIQQGMQENGFSGDETRMALQSITPPEIPIQQNAMERFPEAPTRGGPTSSLNNRTN